MKKTAVVLMNLGGPDRLEAVQPFLFNLFYDKAMLRIINPFRFILATFISRMRAGKARRIYQAIGGKSPILENTLSQAAELQRELGINYKVFTCMRYWNPRANEVINDVKGYEPTEVILLSLYPQYSTTTIQSSIDEWFLQTKKQGFECLTKEVFSYPTLNGFVKAMADLTEISISKLDLGKKYRILFSAHGLPKKIIKKGDPYQTQIESTVDGIVKALAIKDLDSQICYQSRVGRSKWLGPSTEAEIRRAGKDGKAIVLVPVSFVSEHSETLYELDIKYKELADKSGIPQFIRVPTVGATKRFIRGLAVEIMKKQDG